MACPDPDQLALVASGSGSAPERQAVLDHAAGCAECHAVIVVLAPTAAPGASLETAASLLPAPAAGVRAGDTVDRYRLGDELGRGAMGVVYAARDPELDREVAVKVLRASASAARLKREAQALARLTHPNVVRVYDVGEHEGHAFVAMELVRGSNLRQWLRTPRTYDQVMTVLRRAGEGLAAAHRAGLVHRDVKPDNVFVSDDGGVLVGDFGLARSADASASAERSGVGPPEALGLEPLTATGAVVGTPAYMAPEQNEGEATAASDQYAFAVMAWEALYGQRPILGTSLRELRERASAGSITPPPADKGVPARVDRALRRGLSPSPEARFPSMDALLAALTPAVRRRWLVPAVALAAVATGGAAILAATGAVSGGAADREAACRVAAAAIAPDWTAEIAARVRERTEDGTAAALGHWVDRWRLRRNELCRAATGQGAADPRVACLERARVSFRHTVAGLVGASTSLQPDAIVQILPSLDRCDVAGPARVEPPPQVAAKLAEVEDAISTAELGALSNMPRVTRAQVAVLAAEAQTLGFPPAVLRVQLLDGVVAALTGDETAAKATLRAVVLGAEAQADDFTRARAGAHLALVLARLRDPETTTVVTSARAALARAGQDAATEILLLEAEAAFGMGQSDYAAAAAAQDRIVELTIEQFGPDAPSLAEAYMAASGAWALAKDPDRAAARSRDMTAFLERSARRDGAPRDGAAVLNEDANAPFVAGDFAKVREISLRQLAHLRSMPVPEPHFSTYVMAQLARASEMVGDCNEALGWYAEVEAILRRPAAEIAGTSPPDPTGVRRGLVDSLLGQGACLLDLDKADAAVAKLRDAEAEAIVGGVATAGDLAVVHRNLGQALAAAGQHRDAIAMLSPIVDGFPASAPRPYSRAVTAFALARSLWATGGVRDRERAHALVNDAERELHEAEREGRDPSQPAMRIMGPRSRKQLAAVAAWRASHPLGPRSPAPR